MRNLRVMLDQQRFDRKPSNEYNITVSWDTHKWSEVALVSASLNRSHTEVNPRELAAAMRNGQSMCVSYFNTKDPKDGKIHRRNVCFTSCDIVGLDFDDSITIQSFIERCRALEIIPAFIYTTFSHSEEQHKFRAIYVLKHTITDVRLRQMLQLALMRLFPECDDKCKDPARLFFGGREIVFESYDSEIEPLDVINTYIVEEEKRDKSNAKRNIKQYCQECGADMINGYPAIQEIQDQNVNWHDENNSTSIIYKYRAGGDFVKYRISFAAAEQEVKKSCDEEPAKKYAVKNSKIKRQVQRRYRFDQLFQNCKLYREFMTGERWCYHNELFGMATNLLHLEGGETRFWEGLEAGQDYDYSKWEAQIRYLNGYQYSPMRCDRFCPHASSCVHNKNILQQVEVKRGSIRKLQELPVKSLEKAEEDLERLFNNAMAAKDNKVYVIKAPTGIGKTRLYTQADLNNVMIAVPRHNLLQQVADDLSSNGIEYLASLKRPTFDDLEREQKIKKYIDLNLHKEVRQEIENYVLAALFKKCNGIQLSKSELDAIEYSRVQNSLKDASTILVTHKKLLNLDNKNITTCIIDEDILLTSVFHADTINIDDFHKLRSYVISSNCIKATHKKQLEEQLSSIIKDLEDSCPHIVNARSVYTINTTALKKVMQQIYKQINSNILGFLDCDYYIKRSDKTIQYKTNKAAEIFKQDKKYIILSATASEELYRTLLGDRLVFHDIGLVETRGSIMQYAKNSYSRSSLYDSEDSVCEKAFHQISEKVGALPVFFYKSIQSKENFRNAAKKYGINIVGYFGATSGINEFKGKDIAVVGTPHVNNIEYLLLASCLGHKVSGSDQEECNYKSITRNGYQFYFNTFESSVLQEIQLWMIESELIQAIGRARALREDATVTVLSNLIVPGAQVLDAD